jgi:hypothetical protein
MYFNAGKMLLAEVLGLVFGSGDGVSDGSFLSVAKDLEDIYEPPKDVSRCVEKTQ